MSTYNTKNSTKMTTRTGAQDTRSFQSWLAAERGCLGDQMLFLASNGYRCIAHDRQVHGRSGQSRDGIAWRRRPICMQIW